MGSFRKQNAAAANTKPREVKVVMVGESGVGKSSVTIRFANNHFKDNGAIPTIGASFLSKTIYINETPYKFNIWDTAGQEKYRSLAALYYRGVDCAIIVYDITRRETFLELERYWIQELKHQCYGTSGLQICIAGNKSDLEDKRQVSFEEGQELAAKFGTKFFETSAKSNENIMEIFLELGKDLPESDRTLSSDTADLYQVHVPPRKTGCC